MVFMPHWPQMLGNRPAIDLGLERVQQLLNVLGNPHHHLPPVIHVAGTNGKGSTIAFLKAMLEKAGYKVHSYTSPHLLNFNERISIAGRPINDSDLYQILEETRLAAEQHDIPVTFFEGTTVAAFLTFHRKPADIVLLETGLGGRLDATNVIDVPMATVITPISVDHTEYLGPTIELIAREKAGIIKAACPCIVSLQHDEIYDIVQSYADAVQSPTYMFGYDWHVTPSHSGMTYHNKDLNIEHEFTLPNLLGDHQIINAATAITTALHLKSFDIQMGHIQDGLISAKWPARLQHITSGSLIDAFHNSDTELWIDGAHNVAAAHTLAQTIGQWDQKPLYILLGMTKGRDVQAFLAPFQSLNPTIIGTLVTTEPSAYSANYINTEATNAGFTSIECDDLDDALRHIAHNEKAGARVLCTGSLYLSSDIYKANNQPVFT